MKRWFVVHTLPHEERRCINNLMNQGFEAYLPCFEKMRRHAGKREIVRAPLFPRYVFVRFDVEADRWASINSTRGAAYILTQNNKPVAVADEIVEQLKLKEDTQGLIAPGVLLTFQSGERIKIVGGGLKGQEAVVDKMTDKNRVQVLFSLLGREVSLNISRSMVEVA